MSVSPSSSPSASISPSASESPSSSESRSQSPSASVSPSPSPAETGEVPGIGIVQETPGIATGVRIAIQALNDSETAYDASAVAYDATDKHYVDSLQGEVPGIGKL
jgi:hypothetical protein